MWYVLGPLLLTFLLLGCSSVSNKPKQSTDSVVTSTVPFEEPTTTAITWSTIPPLPPVTSTTKHSHTHISHPTFVHATLKFGSKGVAVERLQAKLGVKQTGRFGPVTLLAVRKFQKRHGLKVDGVVGKFTARRLGLRY